MQHVLIKFEDECEEYWSENDKDANIKGLLTEKTENEQIWTNFFWLYSHYGIWSIYPYSMLSI